MENLAFEGLMCDLVPQEKRYILNCKVESDRHLSEIAKNLTNWQGVVPYLGLTEADEEAIKRDHDNEERKRLVQGTGNQTVRRLVKYLCYLLA